MKTILYKVAFCAVFSCSLFTLQSQAQQVRIFNTENSGLPDDQVTAISIDSQGNKWFGTNSGFVAKFDDTSWTIYDFSDSSIPFWNTNSIAVDRDGKKWFGIEQDDYWGTEGGVAVFDDVNWSFYNSINSGLPYNSVSDIAIDAQGNKWFVCNDGLHGALAKFDESEWTVYNSTNSGLPEVFFKSMAIDKNGNIWLGTSYSGVVVFNENGITTGLDNNISVSSNDFKVYPNPAKDFISIDGLQAGTLEIFNSAGVIVKQSKEQSTLTRVDISNLPDGIYSIRAMTKDKVATKKFIKKN